MSEHRSNERKAIGLLVKLSHRGVDEFAQKYATNLSDGGMFIRSREPKPVGTRLHFKVELADGKRVLQGEAVVRWVRQPGDPSGAPGMGLQFEVLDAASRALVDRMLASRAATPLPQVAPAIAPTVAPPPVQAPPPPRPAAATEPQAPPRSSDSLASELFGDRPPPDPPPPLDSLLDEAPVLDSGPELDVPPEVTEPAAQDAPVEPASATAFELDVPAPSSNSVELDLGALLADTPEPPMASSSSVELDVDVLLAGTPEPPASSNSVEVDLDVSLAAEPAAAPAVDVELDIDLFVPADVSSPSGISSLPDIRRELPLSQAQPATAPVVLREAPRAPEPTSRRADEPVFLREAAPTDTTGPIIGIDLGTTNSACAVLSKGRPVLVASKDGYTTIPSVVALSKQGKLQVGHRAKSQLVLNPTQSIFGAKRLVGREFHSPTVKQVRERFHYQIVPDGAGRAAVRLEPHTLTLEEVQGLILRECRDMAQQYLNQPVSRAVVTCPAYYSEPQREAVRRAGALAGLKVERVLNEPTAAALAFGMNRELNRTVLVYDLGGGTFDATLLKLDKNVFEVLATGGDVFLGGVDFDNQVVDVMLERFQAQHGRPFAGDNVALSRVSEVAELAKVALSERQSYDVHLPMLEFDPVSMTPKDLKCTLTRADIEAACGELVDRTIQVVLDVLLDARLKPSDVDDVILVGGQSRMPLVREQLKATFHKPPHASVNADEAVALGAALYTGTLDKVSSLVLIDVVPMTIGLGRAGGAFHRLIERNTPLPATRSFGISTQEDDQQVLEVMVFQGEDSNVAGNDFLGAVRVEGLPRGPKGSVQLAITLSLDAECVLKVEAREFRTRKSVQATLATRYTSEEATRRLGVSAEKQTATQQKRAEELEKRAGGFWSKLKRVFGRG